MATMSLLAGAVPRRHDKGLTVSERDNSLSEALAAILKPIVKEAVREAMGASE